MLHHQKALVQLNVLLRPLQLRSADGHCGCCPLLWLQHAQLSVVIHTAVEPRLRRVLAWAAPAAAWPVPAAAGSAALAAAHSASAGTSDLAPHEPAVAAASAAPAGAPSAYQVPSTPAAVTAALAAASPV